VLGRFTGRVSWACIFAGWACGCCYCTVNKRKQKKKIGMTQANHVYEARDRNLRVHTIPLFRVDSCRLSIQGRCMHGIFVL